MPDKIPVIIEEQRQKIREAMQWFGLHTFSQNSAPLAILGNNDTYLIAQVEDVSDYIEFGIRQKQRGICHNLVRGLLIIENGDFWVSSDVEPNLNGRIKLENFNDSLFSHSLAYIWGITKFESIKTGYYQ